MQFSFFQILKNIILFSVLVVNFKFIVHLQKVKGFPHYNNKNLIMELKMVACMTRGSSLILKQATCVDFGFDV